MCFQVINNLVGGPAYEALPADPAGRKTELWRRVGIVEKYVRTLGELNGIAPTKLEPFRIVALNTTLNSCGVQPFTTAAEVSAFLVLDWEKEQLSQHLTDICNSTDLSLAKSILADLLGAEGSQVTEETKKHLQEALKIWDKEPEKVFDALRFVLLHELGHVESMSLMSAIPWIVAASLVALAFFFLVLAAGLLIPSAGIIALDIACGLGLLLTACTVSYLATNIFLNRTYLQEEEKRADLFAANAFPDNAEERKKIREGGIFFFEQLCEKKESSLWGRLNRFIFDPHPTHAERIQTLHLYPEVNDIPGFFVDVLNKGGYLTGGKTITIPPAGKPREFSTQKMGFQENLKLLKTTYSIDDKIEMGFQFKDRSTEEAIHESLGYRIALNFANEHHIGGGPGFHREKTGLLVYDSPSARAQEESLCQRSDLMASLTQLPHTLKADPGTNFIRSYYAVKFDSRSTAYISMNSLFAVQEASGFYASHYLEEPKSVAFITSAAKIYAHTHQLDCTVNSDAYQDARQRIETHLLAAASQAAVFKKENSNQRVELILGAFGCGAFAPTGNPDEYRKMIANLYKELLPEFQGFFDVVTFAVPTFGNHNPLNPAVANHRIFKDVLEISKKVAAVGLEPTT